MHHCVGSYHDDVDSGSSIIFSLIDQEKVRSTLELSFIKNKWRVVQNRGTWNHQVAASFDAAALQVAKVQNELLRSLKKQPKHTRIETQ